MNKKMRLAILVAIAIILIFVVVFFQATDSNEVATTRNNEEKGLVTGKVGVTILPPKIEDKLAAENYEK